MRPRPRRATQAELHEAEAKKSHDTLVKAGEMLLLAGNCVARAEALITSLEAAMRKLLGDLSDAERTVTALRFTGGMGANIAQEDAGRFPSFQSKAHREEAESLMARGPLF